MNSVFLLDSLTLEQKIAQMVITSAKGRKKKYIDEFLKKTSNCMGGIILNEGQNPKKVASTIKYFQEKSTIPILFAIDLEGGCFSNPFDFCHFPPFGSVESEEHAYRIAVKQGKLLKSLGFAMNFSPVVDLEDKIWNHRSFRGSLQEITKKSVSYIKGLQSQGIMATAKHYPGKTLVNKDPHKATGYAKITKKDLLPFEKTIANNVAAIMVSNIIIRSAFGIDSESKPACASEKLVAELRKGFDGLIITDAIRMKSLTNHYKNEEEMYLDVFKADNDLIIENNPEKLYRIVSIIKYFVKHSVISEGRIERSVKRILKAKEDYLN